MLSGDPASQFRAADVEIRSRKARRSGRLIQALNLDQEGAYAAGEVGFLAWRSSRRPCRTAIPRPTSSSGATATSPSRSWTPKDVGLLYGRYPRLVLAYLTTEAVRRKSADLELGSHFSHFCAALGIPPTTGPRSSLPMLREGV